MVLYPWRLRKGFLSRVPLIGTTITHKNFPEYFSRHRKGVTFRRYLLVAYCAEWSAMFVDLWHAGEWWKVYTSTRKSEILTQTQHHLLSRLIFNIIKEKSLVANSSKWAVVLRTIIASSVWYLVLYACDVEQFTWLSDKRVNVISVLTRTNVFLRRRKRVWSSLP